VLGQPVGLPDLEPRASEAPPWEMVKGEERRRRSRHDETGAGRRRGRHCDRRGCGAMKREFDTAKARRTLDLKWTQEKKRARRLWEEARRDASAIVQMLIRKYDPRRIYQWGSVLDESRFTEMSDLDIGVEGVESAERFFAMCGDAQAMTRFSLDLVEMEKIEPEFADIIRMKGKVVYERDSGSD